MKVDGGGGAVVVIVVFGKEKKQEKNKGEGRRIPFIGIGDDAL